MSAAKTEFKNYSFQLLKGRAYEEEVSATSPKENRLPPKGLLYQVDEKLHVLPRLIENSIYSIISKIYVHCTLKCTIVCAI